MLVTNEAEAILNRIVNDRWSNIDPKTGRLSRWPELLQPEDVQKMVDAGVCQRISGGGDTYGHTEYFVNMSNREYLAFKIALATYEFVNGYAPGNASQQLQAAMRYGGLTKEQAIATYKQMRRE